MSTIERLCIEIGNSYKNGAANESNEYETHIIVWFIDKIFKCICSIIPLLVSHFYTRHSLQVF